MRRGRWIVHNILSVLSLALPVGIAVAWGVSAMSFPHVRGPMPGGEGAAQDHVLACLVDGRLIAMRRAATLVASSPDMRMTLEEVSAPSHPQD